MRKFMWLATLAAIGLICGAASAQISGITGYCNLGAKQAAVSGLNSTNYLQGVIPKCLVTVYLTGTTTPAMIYSNVSGTPLAQPFFANATTGQWLFFAAQGQGYDVVLSGGVAPNTYPAPVTLTDLFAGGGSGSGGGQTVLATLPLASSLVGSVNTLTLTGCTTAVTFSSTPVFNLAQPCASRTLTLTGAVSSSTATNVIANLVYEITLVQDATGGRTFVWPTTFKTTSAINLAANGRTHCFFTADADLNLYPNGACTWN